MAQRKKTISNNPLDAVVGGPSGSTKVSRRIPSIEAKEDSRSNLLKRVMKERLTVHVPQDLIERVKNAVYWTPGLTLASLAEEALEKAIDALERKQGKPYAKRTENLKGGRPMK